jgi:murein endopeptidase
VTGPVQGREDKRLTHGKANPGLAGNLLVDEIGQAQPIGGRFEGGDRAMFEGLDPQGARGAALK